MTCQASRGTRQDLHACPTRFVLYCVVLPRPGRMHERGDGMAILAVAGTTGIEGKHPMAWASLNTDMVAHSYIAGHLGPVM